MDLDSASTMWQALPEVREGGRPACAAQVGKLVGGVLKRSLRIMPLACTVGMILPDVITPRLANWWARYSPSSSPQLNTGLLRVGLLRAATLSCT